MNDDDSKIVPFPRRGLEPSSSECRERAKQFMAAADETSDPQEKARLLREAGYWLSKGQR